MVLVIRFPQAMGLLLVLGSVLGAAGAGANLFGSDCAVLGSLLRKHSGCRYRATGWAICGQRAPLHEKRDSELEREEVSPILYSRPRGGICSLQLRSRSPRPGG